MAVLLVIVLASLVGTTVLIVADADRAGAEVSLHRTQSRALAWSGVQAVMAELASQRDSLLDGKRPRVTDEWTVVGGDGDVQHGLFRLIPLSADGPLVSESAKLDLNTATAEMLARVPGVGPDLAGRIVAARDAAPLSSVEALLAVGGIGPEQLYGPPTDAPSLADKTATREPALADLVTVFSFDPNVQLGLGPSGDGHRGELRLNINTPWSDGLEKALVRRFDQDFANGVKEIMKTQKFERDGDVVAVLIGLKVEPKDWVQTFDVFTTSPDPYLLGRVDLNTAAEEVLACIPGIDEAAAGRIVGMRGRLEAEALKSVSWPAAEGVLTPEQFRQAADYLTTRSMQWRVRVEAGFEEADSAFSSAKAPAETAPKLRDRIELEAVIDVSSERPRVAYLREVTQLDAARREFAKSAPVEEAPPEPEQTNREAGGAEAADEMDADAEGPSTPSRLGQVSSRVEAAKAQHEERVRPKPAPDVGAEESETPAAPESVPAAGDSPEAGQDRRIGRWNPAGGSQGGRR